MCPGCQGVAGAWKISQHTPANTLPLPHVSLECTQTASRWVTQGVRCWSLEFTALSFISPETPIVRAEHRTVRPLQCGQTRPRSRSGGDGGTEARAGVGAPHPLRRVSDAPLLRAADTDPEPFAGCGAEKRRWI